MTHSRRIETIEPKDVDETDVVTFDFTRAAQSGETVSSAVVTAEVYHGEDEDPASILLGSPTPTAATALQSVSGGLAGVTYLLRCVATMSSGRVLVAAGLMPVVRLAP